MSTVANQESSLPLTGGMRELSAFFFPTVLMIFSNYLNNFIEKILFSYFSSEVLSVGVNVHFVARVFQLTFVTFALFVQAYVAKHHSAGKYQDIGTGIWQLIWFSLLSSIVVIPAGIVIGNIYFHGSPISQLALPYLYFYLIINFIFPLKATLTGFYLGIGKASWVAFWAIGSNFLQISLNFVLIPRFGLMGAAFSAGVIQLSFCLFLFLHFTSSRRNQEFKTRHWQYRPTLLWSIIKPGFHRASFQIVQTSNWVLISYFLTRMGSLHNAVLVVGTTLFYFYVCFPEAMQISMMNWNSRFIGAKLYHLIQKSLRTAAGFIFLLSIPFIIPLLIFPETVFPLLFPKIVLEPTQIRWIFGFLWVCFLTSCFQSSFVGMLFAFKETKFFFFIGLWCLAVEFGLITFTLLKVLRLSPIIFWALIFIEHLCATIFYTLIIKKIKNRLFSFSTALTEPQS